jgi:arsenate reductase
LVTVLFACVENAGRSQMAAALFNASADPAKARAISAGTRPAPHVNPLVVDALRAVGIDISQATPQRLTIDLAGRAQWLITMGCGEDCPVVPGVQREDWPVPDPRHLDLAGVCAVRDGVAERVAGLIARNDWA